MADERVAAVRKPLPNPPHGRPRYYHRIGKTPRGLEQARCGGFVLHPRRMSNIFVGTVEEMEERMFLPCKVCFDAT